jgi:hypothetical protein
VPATDPEASAAQAAQRQMRAAAGALPTTPTGDLQRRLEKQLRENPMDTAAVDALVEEVNQRVRAAAGSDGGMSADALTVTMPWQGGTGVIK